MTDLGDRTKYVGGSDVASILGMDPYTSSVELWAEKTGQIEPEDFAANKHVDIGNAAEPGLIAWAGQRTLRRTLTLEEVSGPGPLTVHPDGITGASLGMNSERPGIIEAKTGGILRGYAGKEWGDDGTDVIPQQYLIQVHAIAACLRSHDTFPAELSRVAWVPALLGGRGLHLYRVDIDPEVCDAIVETVGKWWRDYVVADKMPPEGWASCSSDALLRLRREPGSTAVLGDDRVTIDHGDGEETLRQQELVEYWQKARELRLAVRKRERRYQDALIAAMDQAEFGEYGGEQLVSLAKVEKRGQKPYRYARLINRDRRR